MPDYLRDPAAIYAESFAVIRAEARLEGLPPDMATLAVRLIHACGMIDIADSLAWTPDAMPAARAALTAGAPILADTRMVAEGIIADRLPEANPVVCTIHDAATRDLATRTGTTRAAAAVDLWRPRLEGAVVAIGNAPTALFRLLEVLADGAPRPAAVLAFPVGFVGAAESKQALIDSGPAAPYVTLRGRRGGSALAAAAVNALAAMDNGDDED